MVILILYYLTAFQTPCSTPPGSEVSSQTSSRNPSVDMANINELLLHNKLYDKLVKLYLLN